MIILKCIFRNGGGGHELYYSGSQYGRVVCSMNAVIALKCVFHKMLENS
jgi:hypothetical protein